MILLAAIISGFSEPIFTIFTARRYAKRGICRRVCVCVCLHTPVLYQNG